jgi:flagellar hook assembly protein FlgD
VHRRIQSLLVGFIVAVGALAVPAGVAAADPGTPPKVVIIVGPVAGMSDSYRADAQAAATEALKYTPNVVTLFTPNATWAVVKPALQGASIVMYMGHGNGFPSPYTTTLMPDRQDGLGLNPVAGQGDVLVKYEGESILASTVQLAPNAIVLLHHLCYASGNPEPGNAEPTLDVATQRVDNFAAGFLAAGARAVIADSHYGAAAATIQALFTTHQTIDQLWQTAPTSNGNFVSLPSVRTPGMTMQLDPNTPTSGFYRSMVADLTLQTDSIVGASSGSSGQPPASPGSFTVPGTATVNGVATGLYSDPSLQPDPSSGQPAGTLPPGAAVWLIAQVGSAPDGSLIFFAQALGTGQMGYMSSTNLLPDAVGSVTADLQAPVLTPSSALPSWPRVFSPNGDGQADTWAVSLGLSEDGWVDVTVQAADGIALRTISIVAVDGQAKVVWDGRSNDGSGVPDGRYTLTLTSRDAAGNAGTPIIVPVTVYRALASVATSATVLYPEDLDVLAGSTSLSFVLLSQAIVTWRITDATGAVVYTVADGIGMPAGTHEATWDGRDMAGNMLPVGTYLETITVTDGTLSNTVRTKLTLAAFGLRSSTSRPVRGGTITVTAVSAEPLSGTPLLVIRQPGITSRTVAMHLVGPNTWRATVRLSRGGRVGTLRLDVKGIDSLGGRNASTLNLRLR